MAERIWKPVVDLHTGDVLVLSQHLYEVVGIVCLRGQGWHSVTARAAYSGRLITQWFQSTERVLVEKEES